MIYLEKYRKCKIVPAGNFVIAFACSVLTFYDRYFKLQSSPRELKM